MPSDFESLVLANPHRWALFLDVDGTLIDVAPDPAAVRIPSDLPHLLTGLEKALAGALALNTGRQITVVDEMLSPLRLKAAGVHGTELRLGPQSMVETLAPRVPPALVDALRLAVSATDAVLVEDKRIGLAVHYRKAPELEAELAERLPQVMEPWPAYEIKGGRKIFEIIPKGFSKATAIRHFLEHEPFRRRVPLVIGDDRGDEPALAIARAMGGAAFTVAGEYFPAREADFSGATAVRGALHHLLEVLSSSPDAGKAAV